MSRDTCISLLSPQTKGWFNWSLPLSWLNDSRVKQHFIQCVKIDTVLLPTTLFPEMMGEEDAYSINVKSTDFGVRPLTGENSNPSSAIYWLCEFSVCKLTPTSLTSPNISLDSNSSHLLRCGMNK